MPGALCLPGPGGYGGGGLCGPVRVARDAGVRGAVGRRVTGSQPADDPDRVLTVTVVFPVMAAPTAALSAADRWLYVCP